MDTSGKRLWVIAVLSCLGLLLGLATAWAQAPTPDLINDGVVNILDVSLGGELYQTVRETPALRGDMPCVGPSSLP